MPEEEVIERARRDQQEGKSPSTQAGEFVREEIEHVRQGVHGARSTKQAIAIGLSKARRAGVKLPPRKSAAGAQSSSTGNVPRRKKRRKSSESSGTRARASLKALRREPKNTVSHSDLAKQARSTSRKRGAAQRHNSAEKAVRTKRKMGTTGRSRRRPRRS